MHRRIYTIALAILTLSTPFFVHAYASPGKPTGLVNDFANVLPVGQKQIIEAKLQALQRSTGDEVTVVTIPSLSGDTIENYANKLFQEWGIGQKDKDNGLLILVSTGDHEARIEVGYGLEGTVTDLQSGNIIRKVMIPAFRNDDYAGGISGAVDAISEIITGSPDAAQYSEPAADSSSSSDTNNLFGALFFLGFIILNALVRILGRTKSWWFGGVLGAGAGVILGLVWGFFFAGIISVIGLTILGLVFDYIVSKFGGRGPGRPGGFGGLWPLWFLGGRGGGSGSGSNSGSFGGFGGGSSGGGGASGSW